MPELWAEFWTRPGHANFGRVIDEAPAPTFSFHDGLNLVGDGSMPIAESFDRFDEILKLDPATPSNAVSSLCRIFSEEDETTPIFEWLPNLLLPTTDKKDQNVDITGLGIKSILSHARTEAFDWDGSDDFVPKAPDWIWGGRNLLRNPGFELSGTVGYIYDLWNDGSGGTFTLTWDGQTTAAIAWNASATTVNNRLEALSNVTDVLVSGVGTEADPWRIEMVDPAFATATALSCDGALLTGDTLGCVLTTVQVGSDEVPDAWEPSQRADRRSTPALHGNPTIFRRSSGAEPVRDGTYSLVISGTDQYTGGQQVLSVTPGGITQPSVFVNSDAAGQTFRLVARDRYERILTTASGAEAFVEVSPAADTFVEMAFSDLLANLHEPSAPGNIGEAVSEVVFRFANVTRPSPAGTWYFDTAGLTEGQAATHPGGILTALYDDAVSNHAERIVWEDEANPGNPYLTLDFGALDSAGAAWVDQELSIKIWMRMSFLDVMNQIAQTWGYEWRVVPLVVEDGTWEVQVYNPGTMKTDYTASQTPAIQGGASDVRRQVRRYLPTGTDLLVEGEERITSRDRDGDLVTALGRIESSRIDRELPSQEAVIAAAFEDKTDAVVSGLSYVYTLVDPADEPLSAYVLGDLLTIHDPPEVTDEARLVDIEVVVTPDETVYETEWIPATAEGS